jgi:hypothetical protein
MKQVLPDVLPLIGRFSATGKLLRDIPPFVFFRAFLGLFFSYYITELMIAGTPIGLAQGSQALEQFIDIFLHGVLHDQPAAA